MTADEPSAPIVVSMVMPLALRIGLGLFGAVILGVGTSELWRGVWPLSVVTPFFGLLLAVVVMGGGGLLLGSLFGPNERWRIEPGRLTVTRSLRRLRSRQHYRPDEIATIKVETSEWDSKPDTYCLAVTLASGKRLRSPEFGTLAKAEQALAMLNAAPG